MWKYVQETGEIIAPDGKVLVTAYSGFGEGVNNPAMQDDVDVGPIPTGAYLIGGPRNSPTLGPYVLNLTALPGTDTHERSLFRIHGDTQADLTAHLRDASHGCVVTDRASREVIGNSGDTLWVVYATKADASAVVVVQTPAPPAPIPSETLTTDPVALA